MTPEQFKTIRVDQLGLSQSQLAPLLGYNSFGASRISSLERGARDIPWHVGQLMLCYALLGVKRIPVRYKSAN